MARRAKYKTRPDGRKETTKTYKNFGPSRFSGRRHFYGKSDDEVDARIEAFERELLNAPDPAARKISDLADAWWEENEKNFSLNSVGSYVSKLKDIEDEFGDLPAADLTAQMIYQWLARKAAQGLSQKSITGRKSVLNQVLSYALALGVIDVNPCTSVPIVKGVPAKKRRPASDPDVSKIEEHKADNLIARMFYFMEYTGCRVGECVVLQEKDIDREHYKARIYKDIAFRGQEPVVKNTAKTEAGTREVDLYDNVLEILPKYKNPETYIFFPDGLPRKSPYETVQRKYRKQIGITATAHQLRHSYAGIMHSAEIDVKDTQARMGHSSIVVTQDIYTEIERHHSEKVRNKANDYIMHERLGRDKKTCPSCGSRYLSAEDGHAFTFCPDCGTKLS